ncbi:hypothetical protein F5144DRAFT_597327 [Chaetomium tenue]|uniref:Uncharacterized protein n=1 Tax=Chaetomium tenue TaxID=1854479 RepID=A0ACB7PQC6_9PEZI|nr:hypothetical protein F5144DRAFT_597327 [Chaetomium globosum]
MAPPLEPGPAPHLRRSRRRRAPGGDSVSVSDNREGHDGDYSNGNGNEEGNIGNAPSHRRPSRSRTPAMSRDTTQWRAGSRGTLLGFLTAVMVAAFWAWFAWGWAGDPRVNVRVSKLGPDDIDIVTSPSPLTDFITIADTVMEASVHMFLPHRTSNITLALNAPGLPPVDVASWLPTVQVIELVRPPTKLSSHREKVRPLKAEHAPLVVSLANITLTLELMDTLWPVLLRAASGLLFSGLSPEHPKYDTLNESLAEPPRPELLSLVRAGQIWGDLYSMGREWPRNGLNLLTNVRYDIESEVSPWPGTRKGSRSKAGSPNIRSARLPDPRELLQDARRSLIPGRTLPGYLASLRPSSNTSVQLDGMLEALTRRPTRGLPPPYYFRGVPREDGGLWMEPQGFCDTMKPTWETGLRETAEGRCRDPERYFAYLSYGIPKDVPCTTDGCISALRDALCDAEEFLPFVAVAAERVKATVVEERGTPSWFARLVNYFHKDDIEEQIRALDGALAAFYALVQRVCILQDTLRHRVCSALSDRSWWWDLKWDAGREKVMLEYAMLPEVNDTLAILNDAFFRIADQNAAIWKLEDFVKQAVELLKAEVSAGWVARLGLGNLQMEKRQERSGQKDKTTSVSPK